MFTRILHRPAFAIVISIILLFLGVLGIKTLPIAQFPNIAPPTVMVMISYPGASANVLVESVLIPLEQSINGVQNMRYISSSATSAGEAAIVIYFEPGTNPDINVVNVQNRVNIVLLQLPPLVVREGILVLPGRAQHVDVCEHLQHGSQRRSEIPVQLRQRLCHARLKRIKGMGIPRNLGNRIFAMRIWLNPDRMRAYNVSTDDVMKALSEQSVIGSPGRLGQATGKTSQTKEYVLTYIGRFNKPEQYENIILRANPEGEILRLKDVAEVELGSPVLRYLLRHQRASRGVHRSQASSRLQRRRGHRGDQGGTRGDQEGIVPSRHGLRIRLRRLQVSGRLDRKGAAYPARGVHLGVARGLYVPRGFAIHADPDAGGSGVAGRDVFLPAG